MLLASSVWAEAFFQSGRGLRLSHSRFCSRLLQTCSLLIEKRIVVSNKLEKSDLLLIEVCSKTYLSQSRTSVNFSWFC